MAHRTVEQDRGTLPIRKLRNLKLGPVPADSHERQTSGSAGMFHGLRLSVLGDSDLLLIILRAERAVNRPIMRNGHRLPLTIIESRIDKLRAVFPGELPILFQQELTAYLREKRREKAKQTDQNSETCSFHSFFVFLLFIAEQK